MVQCNAEVKEAVASRVGIGARSVQEQWLSITSDILQQGWIRLNTMTKQLSWPSTAEYRMMKLKKKQWRNKASLDRLNASMIEQKKKKNKKCWGRKRLNLTALGCYHADPSVKARSLHRLNASMIKPKKKRRTNAQIGSSGRRDPAANQCDSYSPLCLPFVKYLTGGYCDGT